MTWKGDPVPDTPHTVKIEPHEDKCLDLVDTEALVLDDDETQVEHKKKMEPDIWAWCLAEGCRVLVSDEYFNNPPRSSSMSILVLFVTLVNAVNIEPSAFPCCDNCILQRQGTPDAILTDLEANIVLLIDHILAKPSLNPDISQEVIDVDSLEIVTDTNASLTCRRGDRLKSCHEALIKWRDSTWDQDCGLCSWGPNVLLPEAVIAKLSSTNSVSSLEDMKREVPDWDFAEEYGSAVIDVIKVANDDWKHSHE